MKDLYVVGTGSQARYVIEICHTHNIKGLVDILNKDNVGKTINGVKVICHLDDITTHVQTGSDVVIAIGDSRKKEDIACILEKAGYQFATIISQSAYISKFVNIGKGSIICQNAIVQPNTNIGNHVIIHAGCVIEHDNVIGDFANIAPAAATTGNVQIGKGTYVYTGAVIVPKVKIGEYAVIGAGAVVLNDVPDNAVVVGNPAKPIKK